MHYHDASLVRIPFSQHTSENGADVDPNVLHNPLGFLQNDPFGLLRLGYNATTADFKQQCRKLSQINHPGKGKNLVWVRSSVLHAPNL